MNSASELVACRKVQIHKMYHKVFASYSLGDLSFLINPFYDLKKSHRSTGGVEVVALPVEDADV
jgi:hypothetical protein